MPRIAKALKEKQQSWEHKIVRAKKVRKNWKDLFHVDLARDYFDGKQNPGQPDNEWITINKIYSHVKSQLPALYSVDPYFYIKLKKSYSPNAMDIALFDQRAKVRQAMLNYYKEEIGLKEKSRLSIQDAHFAYGVEKVRYKTDSVENPDFGQPIMGDDGTPMVDDNGVPLMEPEVIPVDERYELMRIHPDDFLWDEDAGPLEDDWNWVAQRIREPLEDAKKNKLFDKKALKALEAEGNTKDEEEDKREERKKGDVKGRSERGKVDKKNDPEEPKIVVRWEIYEIKKKKWHSIAEGGKTPLFCDEEYPPGVEEHPFSILRFTLRDDSPYPIPPISQMIPLAKEYNLTRSRMLKHRKRFNRKYIATGPWDDNDAELSKLESGDDGTIIIGPMGATLDAIKDAPLDQQTTVVELALMSKDLIEVGGGSTDEARGIAGADSATQAGIMNQRLEMREGDAMGEVINFVKTIARKLDQLIQTHITKDEAVKISGPQGEFWELVRVDDYQEINGEFEYSVNVGATMPRLPGMERQSWMAFLTLLSSFPHLLLSNRLIKQMAEMHHIEDEAMLEELTRLGKAIMSGQMPMPGQSGSQAGVGEDRPTSAVGGALGGMQNAT